MNKKIGAAIAVVMIAGSLWAQMTVDPGDKFYSDVQIWFAKGYIFNIPNLRPYPMPVIDTILAAVRENGNAEAQAKAAAYYETLHGTPISGQAGGSGRMAAGGSDQKQAIGKINFEGMKALFGPVSIGYNLGFVGTNKDNDAFVLPSYALPGFNLANDSSKVGPLKIYFEADASVAVGNDRIYMQSGLNNTSWGDFYEKSLVLNQDAFHTGNISFSVRRDIWTYTQALFSLSASDSTGKGHWPEKYMAMHSIDFFLKNCVKLSVYENMIYGRRFDFSYLLPAIPFMAAQGASGFSDDNLQMGVAVTVVPVKNWIIAGDLCVDDLSANSVLKFDFDTKIRIGAQLGVTWAPDTRWLDTVSVDYTLISPYMYTHTQYDSNDEFLVNINYQNYTHYGMPLGSTLAPNSDRIAVKVTVSPVERLSLTFSGSFVRHANVNESLPEEDAALYIANTGQGGDRSTNPNAVELATDGSIFDYPNAGTKQVMDYTTNHFMFMEQPTKEYTVQAGIAADYTIPRTKAWRSITLKAGYVFEYIHNKGVSTDIYTAGSGDKAAAIDAWKSKLTNEINHYVTFGFEYRY